MSRTLKLAKTALSAACLLAFTGGIATATEPAAETGQEVRFTFEGAKRPSKTLRLQLKQGVNVHWNQMPVRPINVSSRLTAHFPGTWVYAGKKSLTVKPEFLQVSFEGIRGLYRWPVLERMDVTHGASPAEVIKLPSFGSFRRYEASPEAGATLAALRQGTKVFATLFVRVGRRLVSGSLPVARLLITH